MARRGRDVRLITHERNRTALSAAFPDLIDRIAYSADTRAHRILWRIGARAPAAIRDHLFGNLMGLITGLQQRRMARRLVRAGLVDLVHQPIPVSPAAPSLLHRLGVPVVIGPMNGAMSYPPGYEDFEGPASRLFVALGRPLAGLANWLIPGKRRAALLLVANTRTRDALPVSGPEVLELCENGVDFNLFPEAGPRPARSGGPFRLVFMGRLVALKGVDITLHALAQARAESGLDITLDILGDGPEHSRLAELVSELGLTECVTFHGFLPQPACAVHLARADALILGSLRECGGAVLLEAQAMGLAVIASDWGGPRDLVSPETGVLIPPSPRDSFAARQAEAIAVMARDREGTRAMGSAGALKTRAEFDWMHKIDQIETLYLRALCRADPRAGVRGHAALKTPDGARLIDPTRSS
jgi:glycosyltransferase involved in cell wall biosynthesis